MFFSFSLITMTTQKAFLVLGVSLSLLCSDPVPKVFSFFHKAPPHFGTFKSEYRRNWTVKLTLWGIFHLDSKAQKYSRVCLNVQCACAVQRPYVPKTQHSPKWWKHSMCVYMEFWTRLTLFMVWSWSLAIDSLFQGFHPLNAVWSSCELFDLLFRPPLGLTRPCVFE